MWWGGGEVCGGGWLNYSCLLPWESAEGSIMSVELRYSYI